MRAQPVVCVQQFNGDIRLLPQPNVICLNPQQITALASALEDALSDVLTHLSDVAALTPKAAAEIAGERIGGPVRDPQQALA